MLYVRSLGGNELKEQYKSKRKAATTMDANNKPLPNNVKDCKRDFIKFVNYYNSHRDQFRFTDDEKDALVKLHAMWKQSNKSSTLNFYFDMKEHHTILNSKLLGYEPEIEKCEEWCNYTENFMRWRTLAMARAHMAQRKAFENSMN
ncbi:hypothetical protein Ocin01_05075 [Orchesella cincta]|uniref:Uncharacterized protein n=1 Tax=Orchesella cincta TaxID=48709 RepID=A0A1D2N8M1_ORCCI|nr:hypothetical protein Ocin01_05075 [Orchesella cincta]